MLYIYISYIYCDINCRLLHLVLCRCSHQNEIWIETCICIWRWTTNMTHIFVSIFLKIKMRAIKMKYKLQHVSVSGLNFWYGLFIPWAELCSYRVLLRHFEICSASIVSHFSPFHFHKASSVNCAIWVLKIAVVWDSGSSGGQDCLCCTVDFSLAVGSIA